MNKRLKKRELYSKDPLQQLFHRYVSVNEKGNDECESIPKERENDEETVAKQHRKTSKEKRLSTLDQHTFVILTKPILIMKLMVEAAI